MVDAKYTHEIPNKIEDSFMWTEQQSNTIIAITHIAHKLFVYYMSINDQLLLLACNDYDHARTPSKRGYGLLCYSANSNMSSFNLFGFFVYKVLYILQEFTIVNTKGNIIKRFTEIHSY